MITHMRDAAIWTDLTSASVELGHECARHARRHGVGFLDALDHFGPVDGELMGPAWLEEQAGIRLAGTSRTRRAAARRDQGPESADVRPLPHPRSGR
jgi:hypothetical protein